MSNIKKSRERSLLFISLLIIFISQLSAQVPSLDNWVPNATAGDIHYGYGTFYGGGYVGGCCMLEPITTDIFVCAMNMMDFETAVYCGAYIQLTGPLGTIALLVSDLMPFNTYGDVDLCQEAFPYIADPVLGKVHIAWRIIPLYSSDQPVHFRYEAGTSQYWLGIQPRNHRYPVKTMEYLDSTGAWINIERKMNNFFESFNMGSGPFTFRITDFYDQVIIEENIPLNTAGTDALGTKQFPMIDRHLSEYGPDTWATPAGTETPASTPVPEDTPITTPPALMIGNVNEDGIINIVDALLVAQFYVGLNPANFNQAAGDVNCDGTVNIVDALLIAQYYVGLITGFTGC